MAKNSKRVQVQVYSKGTDKPMSYSIPLKVIIWWIVGLFIIVFGFLFWLPDNIINIKNFHIFDIAKEQKSIQLMANKLEKQIAEANSQIESGRNLREKMNLVAGVSASSEIIKEKTVGKAYRKKELSTDFEHVKRVLETLKTMRAALLQDEVYANSLPLLHPVKKHQNITNRYGMIQDAFTKRELPHRGLDFAVTEGDTVIAPGDGIVESVTNRRYGFGITLEVQHTPHIKTVYSHLQNVLVQSGKPVKKGQPMATAGKSGSVPWSVLHYEVRYDNQPINPEDYFITP